MPDTRVQVFLTAHGIRPTELARESGVSRAHLLRVRKGIAEPTRRVMIKMATACSRIVRRRVEVSRLFDLGEGRRER